MAEYKQRVLDPANYGNTSDLGRAANANASTNVPVANQQQVPLDHMAASYSGDFLQPSGVVSEHQGDWDANPDGEYNELSYMPTGDEPETAMDEGDLDVMEVQPTSHSSQANATPAST